jgi:hypothetical protein
VNVFKKIRRKFGLNRSSLVSLLPRHLQYVMRCNSRQRNFGMLLKPQTFNQKLSYKMVFDRRPLLVTFADKLLAREYVRQKIGSDVLVKLLVVAASPDDIHFDQLPRRFVLKTNHGSGYVRIVKDKTMEDESDLRRICRDWLSKNYGDLTGEWAYMSITPKIMVESFLETGNGDVAWDYKFFVFNGRVFMIQLDLDRFTDHRNAVFTPDWQRIQVRYVCPTADRPVAKPACLERMLKMAECLGAETDFVRVDLFEVDGRIYFGELTNYPLGGGAQFEPKEFDALLGAQWQIIGY